VKVCQFRKIYPKSNIVGPIIKQNEKNVTIWGHGLYMKNFRKYTELGKKLEQLFFLKYTWALIKNVNSRVEIHPKYFLYF